MQTILGANGQIADELAKELHRNYTTDIRLVSRKPKKINNTDQLFSTNLLDAEATDKAIAGSEIAYLTVGLPMNAQMWEEQFPVMMKNVIEACKKHKTKLVFFDNTYMYAKTSEPQTEESPFVPFGRKSTVRAKMATMLLEEMNKKTIEAVICRAPEFYGTGKTQSITNTLIFDNIKQGKKLKIPIKDSTKRTLIFTPDASRAMALIGNTPNAYNQTWHLPCDDSRPTYKELVNLTSGIAQKEFSYSVIKMWQFKLGSLFNKQVKELQELLPRYKYDNIFISDKFKKRFPDFKFTTYREGITNILNEQKIMKILIIVTNTATYEDSKLATGLWLSELTHMYDLAKKQEYDITIASPKGGNVPLDPESLKPRLMDKLTKEYYEDTTFMKLLQNTKSLSEVSEQQFDAVYLAGGHGTMYDFPKDTTMQNIIRQHYENNKIVSAVCHGVGGLLNVKLSNGDYLIKDKTITGFNWFEESLARRKKEVPFNLEAELKKRTSKYIKAFIPMTSKVVVDGNLITGQNPFSSKEIAKVLIEKLKTN